MKSHIILVPSPSEPVLEPQQQPSRKYSAALECLWRQGTHSSLDLPLYLRTSLTVKNEFFLKLSRH